jgi:hypothetical protein
MLWGSPRLEGAAGAPPLAALGRGTGTSGTGQTAVVAVVVTFRLLVVSAKGAGMVVPRVRRATYPILAGKSRGTARAEPVNLRFTLGNETARLVTEG